MLNSDELKAYVASHVGGVARLERVEWVDDSSANLVFGSESAAQETLISLCAAEVGEISDPTQLPLLVTLPAKPFTGRPKANPDARVELEVRFAVSTDRKVPQAAARSRFYLLNPEYDPENRYGRRSGGGGGGRDRYRDRESYKDRRRQRRDDDEDNVRFDASFYDDDEASLAQRSRPQRDRRRRRNSDGSSTAGSDAAMEDYASRNRSKELFPSRQRDNNGVTSRNRDRDRSISPTARDRRDGDSTPPRGSLASRITRPGSSGSREVTRGLRDTAQSGGGRKKELFPSKVAASASLSVATASAHMDDEALASRTATVLPVTADEEVAELERQEQQSRQLQQQRRAEADKAQGFSIRGLAADREQDSQKGFTIKGAAASARELFPNRFGDAAAGGSAGNAGRELFAGRLEGRGRPRRKAEDLFL